jgi:hypothetical protein
VKTGFHIYLDVRKKTHKKEESVKVSLSHLPGCAKKDAQEGGKYEFSGRT